ncbi:ABC transporter ATP-binding protein/permease wht-1 [Aphelenchoides besseyi]|nr:ABC transporter ATP-binding protein/permease wht-1 [Aphelenchoides besseyi]
MKSYPVNWFVQVRVLFLRSLMTIIRDPVLLQVRLVQIVITALVIGIINWQTPITGPTLTNFESILYNCPRDMNYLFMFPSVHVIASEFPIMVREHVNGQYSESAYFVAKSLAELPQYTILPLVYSTIIYWMAGFQRQADKFSIFCLFNVLQSWTAISIAYAVAYMFANEDMALTYVPLLLQPLRIFGGYYINFDSIPPYFQWMAYASWFRFGFEGLEINQWGDIEEIPGCSNTTTELAQQYHTNSAEYCPATSGVAMLERRDMNPNNLVLDALLLVVVILVARLIGLLSLMLRMRHLRG